VIEAYTLGKAQEVTKILTSEGIPVLQHGKVYEITRVYQSFGIDFGECSVYRGRPQPGHVLVVPPRSRSLEGVRREVRFAVTGWAKKNSAKHRLGVDVAIPLSDHADYDDLLEAVDRVGARRVFCTHGPESFVDRLRDIGVDAHPLDRPSQMRLF
jgi:Cft2 family RNA processing exonuclease